MPKVIHTRPLYGTLDNMTWEKLEATQEHEFRYLSPDLTDEQAAHYLALNGFHTQTVEPKAPEAPAITPKPEIKPEAKAEIEGGDGKINEGAGAKKTPAKKTPARETPAERKARLAAEAQKGAE